MIRILRRLYTLLDRDPVGYALGSILLGALALRLIGVDWDQGNYFHPDERSIYMRVMDLRWPTSFSQFLDADQSPLNPHWFPLGSSLLYLLLAIKTLVGPIGQLGMEDLRTIGRTITVFVDVGNVLLVFLLGRRLYGNRVGLLAAALLAVSVINIQLSHFYRPEVFSLAFSILVFLFLSRFLKDGRWRDVAGLAVVIGLSFAMKITAAPLLVPVALAFAMRLFPIRVHGAPSFRSRLGRLSGQALVGAGIALAIFAVLTPYAILDFGKYVSDQLWESRVLRTPGSVPYTLQFVGTPHYWYEVQQSTVWALGTPLGVVAWAGLGWLVYRAVRYRSQMDLLFVSWIVPFLWVVGSVDVKFLRYIFPVLPFMVLQGSRMLVAGHEVARAKWPRWRLAVPGIAALVFLATSAYAVAFALIFVKPHSATRAAAWINANVPVGTAIANDNHWDESVPDLYRYTVVQLEMFEGETDSARARAKFSKVASVLADSGYLVFYSNRTYGAIGRVPDRYPYSANYYRLMMSGQLGFTLDRAFTSYPSLFGVTLVNNTFRRPGLPKPEGFDDFVPGWLKLDMGYADGDAVDYDHPATLVFHKTEALSAGEIYRRIMLAPGTPDSTDPLAFSAPEYAAQTQGGTWSETFRSRAASNQFPVLSWVLLVEAFALAALPLAWLVGRRLPDRGFGMAKALGWVLVAYLTWLLAALKLMDFTRNSVVVAFIVVAAASALVLARERREFLSFLRREQRTLVVMEAVFLALFLSFVLVRAGNPDLWAPDQGAPAVSRMGEKQMDLAYLNGVLRSSVMPPVNPWYSGGTMNYYYWGQFAVAVPIKALGMDPAVGYNLAVPFLFALTGLGAFAVAYNLAAISRRRGRPFSHTPAMVGGGARPVMRPSETVDGLPDEEALAEALLAREAAPAQRPVARPDLEARLPWWRGPLLAGLLATLFVAVLGNLDGAVQVLQGFAHVARGGSFPGFDFWRSSRLMVPDPPGWEINEFPFFTFLFADLHAHLIVIPMTLLAMGISLAALLEVRERRSWRGAWPLALLAVVVGLISATNTWDYPSYLLLGLGALVAGAWMRPGAPAYRVALVVAYGAAFVLLSRLAVYPFSAHNTGFFDGLTVSKWQTPMWEYLAINGLFFIVAISYLILRLRGMGRAGDAGGSVYLATWLTILCAMVAIGLAAVGLALYVGQGLVVAGYSTVTVLVVLVGLLASVALYDMKRRTASAPADVFAALLLMGAFGLGVVMDLVAARGDIDRMNTVFKLGLEAWVLFGVASGYALWRLTTGLRLVSGRGAWRRVGVRAVTGGIICVLILASAVYPVLGTRGRLRARFNTNLPPTLDGMEYMRYVTVDDKGPVDLREDYRAIRWLQRSGEVRGTPVILEAVNDPYHWSGRVSTYTGMPTVLGWVWHEIQQRGQDWGPTLYRAEQVKRFYTTADPQEAMGIIRTYDVQYVYFGQLERNYYGADGLAKFDTLVSQGLLALVYEDGATRIYRRTGV